RYPENSCLTSSELEVVACRLCSAKGEGDMFSAIMIGVGATALMDLAAVVRARFGAPFPDYGLVGRWIAHAARGQPAHKAIAQAAPVSGEAALGWIAHYVIGIAYAALLLLAFP